MYHLRLIKALSYDGAVSATKEHPDTYTEDEAIAQEAVASGYFELVNESEASSEQEDDGETPEEPESPEPSEEPEEPDGEQEDDGETVTVPAYSGKTLDEMTVPEIETFATYKGVSLKGCKTRAEKVAKLVEELGEEITHGELEYGSPTIVELQTE